MEWAYVLENMGVEDKRSNQSIFQKINDLDLDDAHVYFDSSTDRPELAALLTAIQHGDCLSIRSVEDIADSLSDLKSALQKLADKKIILFSCEEPYLNGANYVEVFVGVVGVYTALRRKQQQTAYQKAIVAGTVGRPAKTAEIEQAVTMYQRGGFTLTQITRATGISKTTLYRYLKKK